MERVSQRVLGRVSIEEIRDPVNGEVIVRSNEEIDETAAGRIDEAGSITEIRVRSVLTCDTKLVFVNFVTEGTFQPEKL